MGALKGIGTGKGFVLTEWRDIPGYPGYKASDDGQIMSFKLNPEGKLMRQHYSNNGYRKLALTNANGKSHCEGVHRFIALAFIPNPDNLPQVNHKNGVRDDNRAENLEWVTSSENHKHAYRELGKVSWAKDKHFKRKAKLTPTEVKVIRQTDIPCSELAELFGVNETTVFNARKRMTYKYLP